jgi:valyl-tRNA synthetase
MSTYLLNDIPFKTVYFHGLVRDEKGRKMSKSLGNIVDPITLIDKHGTDALRMAMFVGVGPGNDSNLGEDKIKAYSKFANKLWNITRFVLENTQEIDRENLPAFDAEDQQTADELDALLKEITGEMNEYKFYLVAEKLYHYSWHTFADIIIERSKTKIMEKNNPESAQRILIEILPKLLRALHPFMPFVTEELWSLIPEGKNGRMLIVEKWPCSL